MMPVPQSDEGMLAMRDDLLDTLPRMEAHDRYIIQALIDKLANHFLATGYIKIPDTAIRQAESVIAAIGYLPDERLGKKWT